MFDFEEVGDHCVVELLAVAGEDRQIAVEIELDPVQDHWVYHQQLAIVGAAGQSVKPLRDLEDRLYFSL